MSRMTRSRSQSSGTRLSPANAELFRGAKSGNQIAPTTTAGDDHGAPVALLPAQPLTADLLTPQEQFWNVKLVVTSAVMMSLYFSVYEPPFLQAICASVAIAVVCAMLLIDEENCDAARHCNKTK